MAGSYYTYHYNIHTIIRIDDRLRECDRTQQTKRVKSSFHVHEHSAAACCYCCGADYTHRIKSLFSCMLVCIIVMYTGPAKPTLHAYISFWYILNDNISLRTSRFVYIAIVRFSLIKFWYRQFSQARNDRRPCGFVFLHRIHPYLCVEIIKSKKKTKPFKMLSVYLYSVSRLL